MSIPPCYHWHLRVFLLNSADQMMKIERLKGKTHKETKEKVCKQMDDEVHLRMGERNAQTTSR